MRRLALLRARAPSRHTNKQIIELASYYGGGKATERGGIAHARGPHTDSVRARDPGLRMPSSSGRAISASFAEISDETRIRNKDRLSSRSSRVWTIVGYLRCLVTAKTRPVTTFRGRTRGGTRARKASRGRCPRSSRGSPCGCRPLSRGAPSRPRRSRPVPPTSAAAFRLTRPLGATHARAASWSTSGR